MLTLDGEFSQLGFYILIQGAPLLELAALLLVAVPQIPQCIVQLHLHLPDDPNLDINQSSKQSINQSINDMSR